MLQLDSLNFALCSLNWLLFFRHVFECFCEEIPERLH